MKKYYAFVLGMVIGIVIGFTVSNIKWRTFGGPKCLDGTRPDANGCCAGEVYKDMGEAGFNCCPEDGGDCFPPIK